MSRPIKKGLDYFPVDTDIFSDEKMQLVFAKYGCKADSVVMRLLCRIYRNGGFIPWDEKTAIIFCNSFGRNMTLKVLSNIIEELLNIDFFNRKHYEVFNILTSNGIQKRYETICRQLHRESAILSTYKITTEETIGQPEVNTEKSTQKKRNEKKRNEIKLNERDILKNQKKDIHGNTPDDYAEAGKQLYQTFYGNNRRS